MVRMGSIANSGLSFPVFIAYGFIILLYLFILRLLLNLLQRYGDKHLATRSVIDRDIHRVMTNDVETSMQAFNAYSVAIVIAKGGIAALAMAGAIVVLVLKFGLIAATLLIVIAVSILWGINHWLKSREKPESVRAEVSKNLQKAGSMGMIVMLSIALVVLIFVMIVIH
jgi:hypothetical protein